jgi:Fic family protein
MLFVAPELTEVDIALLDRIREIRTEVGMFAPAAHRWTGTLARFQRAVNAQSSNAIEGHDVDLADALRVQDGQPTESAAGLDAAALEGFHEAMTYLLALARDETYTYDIGSIRALHRLMTATYRAKLVELKLLGKPGYDDPRPGLWRTGGIIVTANDGGVAFEGPPLPDVAPLMAELVESLNEPSDVSPIVRASMAHLNLVSIHPFADGNGRMSRALQALVLARDAAELAPEFLSIEEWLSRNRQAYYDALAATRDRWTPERPARDWVRFCLRAHTEQALTILGRARRARALGDRVVELAAQLGLHERAETALLEAAERRPITNASYRRQLGDDTVSPNLAARDLRRLVDMGLLVLHQATGRGAHYVAGPRLLSATEDLRSAPPAAGTP